MPKRLGPRLNMALVVFLVLLGAATAGVVLLGFERSQNNATRRSSEGLEAQGQDFLDSYAQSQAQLGYFQFASITEASQQAAQIMFDVQHAGTYDAGWDSSRLIRGSGGQWYDANTQRVSDVFIPNWSSLTPEVERDLRDSAVLDGVFPSILARFPGQARASNFDAVAIYYISTNGVVRYYPPDGFPERIDADTHMSLGIEQLGPAANPERRSVWSAPYQDFAGRGLVMTAQTPVYDGNEFRGVIAVDLSMTRLIAQLDDIHPTPSGFAFYIDSSGSLVESAAAPHVREEILRSNPDFERALHTMTWTNQGVERLTFDGRDVFLSYATFPDVGGRLALVAPTDELTQQASRVTSAIDSEGNRTVGATLGVTGVFFVAALAGAAWFNRRILLRPIDAILAGTQEVGAGNLNARIVVDSDNELGQLARSFNEMTSQLAQAQQHLETRVEERTRELSALLDVANTMSSTLDLDRLLGVILDQLKLVADYSGASLLVAEGDEIITLVARGPRGSVSRKDLFDQRFPIGGLGLIWETISRGESLIIDDVHGDGPQARAFKEATGR
ncbi:MAG TPA: cache domain-containing protein, partial [Gemmatimonadales bacterium]|nr:cache domain-containing protein [Gemmatimonadales bacterium]